MKSSSFATEWVPLRTYAWGILKSAQEYIERIGVAEEENYANANVGDTSGDNILEEIKVEIAENNFEANKLKQQEEEETKQQPPTDPLV